jgi:nitrite reductase (NADH) small subunit
MEPWVDVCRVEDIPSRGARVVARDGAVPIAIFRTAEDAVFALLDRCPHRGGPLSQGLITGTRVVCPLHGWTVDLASGVAAAPDEGCTQAFDVDVCEGRVRLKRADLRDGTTRSAPLCGALAPADVQDAETPFPRA